MRMTPYRPEAVLGHFSGKTTMQMTHQHQLKPFPSPSLSLSRSLLNISKLKLTVFGTSFPHLLPFAASPVLVPKIVSLNRQKCVSKQREKEKKMRKKDSKKRRKAWTFCVFHLERLSKQNVTNRNGY